MDALDLTAHLAGITLEHPVMNAAGTCKHMNGEEGVRRFAQSATSAIVVGSATVEPRDGNSGNVYFDGGHFSLNSIGLANPGIHRYKTVLPEMVSCAHDANKPLIFSIAGFSPQEYGHMADIAAGGGVDVIELNLGCPNVWQNGRQKTIASFSTELTDAILFQVKQSIGTTPPVSVKLSPYSDPDTLHRILEIIKARHPLVRAIVSCNTFPNSLGFHPDGTPTISPAHGLSGLAGSALKPIALGQLFQIGQHLGQLVDLVGVGGIAHGQDVRDFQRAGACCVQVATATMNRGVRVFGEILDGLLDSFEE